MTTINISIYILKASNKNSTLLCKPDAYQLGPSLHKYYTKAIRRRPQALTPWARVPRTAFPLSSTISNKAAVTIATAFNYGGRTYNKAREDQVSHSYHCNTHHRLGTLESCSLQSYPDQKPILKKGELGIIHLEIIRFDKCKSTINQIRSSFPNFCFLLQRYCEKKLEAKISCFTHK